MQTLTHLGIDAGGSKTAWVLLRGDETIAEGVGAPIQVSEVGPQSAALQVARLVERVGGAAQVRVAGVVAGLAGAGNASVRATMLATLRAELPEVSVAVAGDDVLAAASALHDGPGVALWSGTGSFAVARAVSGGLHRVGGRGRLLGDGGGAYDLARQAAAAAVAAADDVGPPTALGDALCRVLAVSEVVELGRRLQAEPPAVLASLCPVVFEVAAAGDRVADQLVAAAADVLAAHALAAARRAGLQPPSTRIVVGGGVLVRQPTLRARVARRLTEAGLPAAPTVCGRAAALGAAVLARARTCGERPLSDWLAGVAGPAPAPRTTHGPP